MRDITAYLITSWSDRHEPLVLDVEGQRQRRTTLVGGPDCIGVRRRNTKELGEGSVSERKGRNDVWEGGRSLRETHLSDCGIGHIARAGPHALSAQMNASDQRFFYTDQIATGELTMDEAADGDSWV